MNFDMGLVPLERSSPKIFMESKNIPIGCSMRPRHEF
jgi:hypothetical protein